MRVTVTRGSWRRLPARQSIRGEWGARGRVRPRPPAGIPSERGGSMQSRSTAADADRDALGPQTIVGQPRMSSRTSATACTCQAGLLGGAHTHTQEAAHGGRLTHPHRLICGAHTGRCERPLTSQSTTPSASAAHVGTQTPHLRLSHQPPYQHTTP
eukprot:252096-Chlamydomonas_euryale.AAC.1